MLSTYKLKSSILKYTRGCLWHETNVFILSYRPWNVPHTTVAMFKSVRFTNGIIAFKIVGFDFSTVRFGMWTVRFVSWTVLSFLARYGTLCPRYALLKVTAGFFNSLFAYKRGRRCLNELWCFFCLFFFFCFFG